MARAAGDAVVQPVGGDRPGRTRRGHPGRRRTAVGLRAPHQRGACPLDRTGPRSRIGFEQDAVSHVETDGIPLARTLATEAGALLRLVASLRERVAAYKVPKRVLFFGDGEIPLTGSGTKVRDAALVALVEDRLRA